MENIGLYSMFYSEDSFWKKLSNLAGKAGIKVIYLALLLYYLFVDDKIDLKSKVSIVAALGYFVLPLDLLPDMAPIIGFTDDLSVLVVTLSLVKSNITESHRIKARNVLSQWFSDVPETDLLAFETGK